MTTSIRFAYTNGESGRQQATLLAYLPVILSNESSSLTVSGLLDTGSTVNVLPYTIGLQLGLTWEEQNTPVQLTGSLARLPARGVIVIGKVGSFLPVELAFAWTQSKEVPVILGANQLLCRV